MQIVNITPHTITIFVDGRDPVILPPSGIVARCATTTEHIGEVFGIPVTATHFGEVTDLPEEVEGVAYIASLLVAQGAQANGRGDVYSPGVLVRGPDGQPLGCRGLSVPA